MKALYKFAPGAGKLELTDRPLPQMNERDNALVRVAACAVCGMDHRIYHGTYPCRPPFIMGHELVGTVERAMDGVTEVKPGDRVVLQPHLYFCGSCAPCQMGLTQFCRDKRSVGIDRDGAMTEYVAVPAAFLHRIPDAIPDRLACLIEPFSMIYGNIVPVIRAAEAKNIVIIGAGQVGMLALAAAKSAGAERVIMSGTGRDVGYRFSVAQKLGAAETINSEEESLLDRVMCLTDGAGADVVLDASGSEEGIWQGMQALRHGGTFIAMGMTRRETIPIHWDACLKKALHINFHMQSNYQYMDEAIQAFAHPYTDLSVLITREAPLSQWKELFDYMDTHDTLKNVLYID